MSVLTKDSNVFMLWQIYYPSLSITEKNACIPNPCKNDGKCVETPGGGFRCICENGHTGETCEKSKWRVKLSVIGNLFAFDYERTSQQANFN